MRASLITYQKLHAQNFEKSAKRHISLNSLLTDAVVLCCVLRECETPGINFNSVWSHIPKSLIINYRSGQEQ